MAHQREICDIQHPGVEGGYRSRMSPFCPQQLDRLPALASRLVLVVLAILQHRLSLEPCTSDGKTSQVLNPGVQPTVVSNRHDTELLLGEATVTTQQLTCTVL